jgi:metal-responsive CopG/Arc/MetJ family transcriptional regulator
MLVARVPDTLLTVVDEVGKEQGARGRSESLRKALELLRELKGKKR